MVKNLIINWLVRGLAILAFALFAINGSSSPVNAEPDLALGAKTFKALCVGCHLGGKNSLAADKNLSTAALQKYKMDSAAAIIAQITNGKGALPAFGKRLKPEEIESTAAYVLSQAASGWGKKS